MRLVLISALVAGGAIGGFLAGRVSARGGSTGSTGPVVVSFRGGELHGDDVAASLKAGSEPMRAQLATREGRRALVDGLVRIELLAAKADEKGYDRDPEFIRRKKQELGAVYLAKEFEEREKSRAPTDDEVRKFFEDHRAERSRPDRVRLGMIAFLSEDPTSAPRTVLHRLARSPARGPRRAERGARAARVAGPEGRGRHSHDPK